MIEFGSVCTGIGSAELAWQPLGWRCKFMSEIDKAARRALQHHYPAVPLHGDFTTIEADDYGAIDLLVGGTPCQDFSIAGLRAGIAGERGNLTLQFLRLAKRKKPRWILWENVPGVLSIDGGRTFGAFLGGLAELGYGFAYRVLDAQYFGLAQRRERVFVVGYLGDWRPPAAVLFERESLLWNPAPSRSSPQDVAAGTLRSTDGGSDVEHARGGHLVADVCPPLNAGGNSSGGTRQPGTTVEGVDSLIVMASGQGNAPIQRDQSPTLTCLHEAPILAHAFKASHYTRGKDGAPAPVAPPLSADADKGDQDTLVLAFSGNDHGADAMADLSPTLRAGGHHKSHATVGVAPAIAFSSRAKGDDGRGYERPPQHYVDHVGALDTQTRHAVAFTQNSRSEVRAIGGDGSIVGALASDAGAQQQNYVAFAMRGREDGAVPEIHGDGSAASALRAASGGSTRDMIACSTVVRRLTPTECERLQGFPDGYTQIPIGNKPTADGPRYKQLGNSMAVPCMRWLGRRIQLVEDLINER